MSITVADVVKGHRGDTQGYYLYLYRDETTIFSVGKSVEPCERLLQHIGYAPLSSLDAVGLLINDNLPQSLDWKVELYKPDECSKLVQIHNSSLFPFFQEHLAQAGYNDEVVRIAEDAMIEHYKLHLNAKGRRYRNPLPDRYSNQRLGRKDSR